MNKKQEGQRLLRAQLQKGKSCLIAFGTFFVRVKFFCESKIINRLEIVLIASVNYTTTEDVRLIEFQLFSDLIVYSIFWKSRSNISNNLVWLVSWVSVFSQTFLLVLNFAVNSKKILAYDFFLFIKIYLKKICKLKHLIKIPSLENFSKQPRNN